MIILICIRDKKSPLSVVDRFQKNRNRYQNVWIKKWIEKQNTQCNWSRNDDNDYDEDDWKILILKTDLPLQFNKIIISLQKLYKY